MSNLCNVLQIDDETFDEVAGESDTIAGLLLEIKGDFPKLHEIIRYNNFIFEVLKIEDRRLAKIKVIQKNQNADNQ